MEWSTLKPVVYGDYWYKAVKKNSDGTISGEMKIVSIRSDDNGNQIALFPGFAKDTPVENLNGEWYGPLKPPAKKEILILQYVTHLNLNYCSKINHYMGL